MYKAPRGHGAALMQGMRCPDLVRTRNKPVPSERQPGSRRASRARAAPGAKDGQGTGQIVGLQQLALSCLAHALTREMARRGLHWSSLLWRHTTTSALCERSKKAVSIPPGLSALI